MKKFSTRASRLVYALSQDEARKSESSQVLPEHLILAMIKNGEGLGYETLKFLRLNVLTFQLALETSLVKLSDHILIDADEIPAGRRINNLVGIAELEASSLKNPYIGTEHIMLAAIRESDSLVSNYFNSASIPLSKVREAVREVQKTHESSYMERVSKDLAANTISSLFGKDSLSEFASFLKGADISEPKSNPAPKNEKKNELKFA